MISIVSYHHLNTNRLSNKLIKMEKIEKDFIETITNKEKELTFLSNENENLKKEIALIRYQ